MHPHKASGARAATRAALLVALLALQPAAVQALDGERSEPLEGVDDVKSYYAVLHPCPAACTGPSSNWTVYSDYGRFKHCDEPVLLTFSLSNPVQDDGSPTKINTCTLGNADTMVNSLFNGTNAGLDPPQSAAQKEKRQKLDGGACEAANARSAVTETKVSLGLVASGAEPETGDKRNKAVEKALQELQAHFDEGASPCEETAMFAYYRGVVAGVYVGPSFGRNTVASVAKPLLERVISGSAATVAAQLCGPDRNANHVFGLVVDTTGNVTAVQQAVRGWNSATCLTGLDSIAELKNVAVWEDKKGLGPFEDFPSGGNTTLANSTVSGPTLNRRADCRTEKVVGGDSCGALASRCGIGGADFMKYNSAKNFCSTLVPGQRVCCSAGTLPDIRPKPEADGTCATYRVVSGDTCASLAASNGITVKDIEAFNKGTTWGWYDCDKLLADVNICLSKGDPPLPFPIANAVCGPTKPGTTKPSGGKKLADLNPCPLNACCNVWGQCGINGEFCTQKNSSSGNPGTSALRNGCVSSCGMDIVQSSAPASFGRVGYYESWNFNRECLHQLVEGANTDGTYTIIHWAFAEINTADWTVKIVDKSEQWESFKSMSYKKVISFGGWAFSNEPGTYDILRQAMLPANRDMFASNVAKFLADEGLDGVDFDWEYPGATDIPGTPAGSPQDGPNYLKFLTTMKGKLASGKTLSIAAPASYWYLKAFPIKKMAEQLDYIVYMTYDLHGQWDASNQWAMEGCPAGNCVRSHVNLTETNSVLAMITKAGVPSNKIFVGESSYGRSFKVSQPGCTNPTCTFLGDRLNSPAAKGRCTNTSGYISNAEIDEIINAGDRALVKWHDADSNSDMLLYDFTEWVAYMTPTTKSTRRELWKSKNFAGTIDWATDLQRFTGDEWTDPTDAEGDESQLPGALSTCETKTFDSVEDVEKAGVPFHCAPIYMADVLGKLVGKVMKDYDDLIKDGYRKKFDTYAQAVVESGPNAVRTFMYGNGSNYFQCTVKEPIHCCKWCHYYYNPEHGECRYCDDKYCNGWSTICEQPEVNCDGQKTGWFDVSPECPPDYSKRAGKEPTDGYGQSVTWRLQASKADAFWADLYAATGIERSLVKFTDVRIPRHGEVCTPTDPKDTCKYFGWDFNFPVPNGYDKKDVIDPEDVVKDAYDKLKGFAADLPKAAEQLRDGTYKGSGWDLVDAVALPIFMVEEAVGAMKNIDDTVDKWEDEKRKSIILGFLYAILFFVPIVGELASTVASLATIGRVITILGAAGELATGIYNVVDTKGNDLLAIFDLILAPLAVFNGVQIAKAAGRARGMDQLEIKKLGKGVSGKINSVKRSGLGVCARKAKREVNVFPIGELPMSPSGLNTDPFIKF
ncbi:hypothetical protein MAPG_09337 [Magnaporthiopsis poae ATCC 64411]|uniref:chitinase n=1 Tax=Magnaporthiopsis poae (strain ATCC 64411 / 73-15) TaxID=644358 RepID=A0A0C4E9P1_MAGP6|nr:hypothetical protein MAPG_09337 [Magnaporthiopsis poae ATCC 64411]